MEKVEPNPRAYGVYEGQDLRRDLEEVLGDDWRLTLHVASGISQTQISRWETDRDRIPRYLVLIVRLIRGEKHIGLDS